MADFSHRHAELQFNCGEDSLYPIQFSARQRISRPFEIDVFARSAKVDLPLKKIIGADAALRAAGAEEMLVWTGICSSIEQTQPESSAGGVSTYYLKIVPNLWLLSQRRGHRIFQHLSAPKIVEQILKEWHIDYTMDVGKHPDLEYRVQYGESDLAFISRLLEEAGIWYYFQREGDTKIKTKVVFKDTVTKRAVLRLPFVDSPGQAEAGRHLFVSNVHIGSASRPGKVTVRDFDFRRPEHGLVAQSQAGEDPEVTWEQYHYSPGGFLIDNAGGGGDTPLADNKSVARHDDDEGKTIAARRLDGARWMKRFIEFESNNLALRPGSVLGIDDHPRDDVNKDVFVIESQVTGNATGEFAFVATGVFTADPFRLPLDTPRPRIDGVQSAVVVGPKDQEIWTDEFGRVRVRFHWDREGEFDDNRTCWLRVSQAWAGPGFGAIAIPRVGHEVLVEFLDGDPDQPVIIGRLFNEVSPVPYKLPDHMTQSTWKTQSSPFKDGYFNELTFDDAVKKELVFVQGQRNLMKLVKRDETRRVGKERLDVIGDHRLAVVAQVDAVHVGTQHLVRIMEEEDLQILKMEDPKLKLRNTWFEVRDEKITLTTGAASIVLDGENIVIEASGGIRFSADNKLIMKVSDGLYLNCSSASGVTPRSDKKIDDQVRKPEDRAATSILKLLEKGDPAAALKDRPWAFQKKIHKAPKPKKAPETPPKKPAFIQPSAPPGTRIFIDGKDVGTAPVGLVEVDPGSHTVTFKLADGTATPAPANVDVGPGQVEFARVASQ